MKFTKTFKKVKRAVQNRYISKKSGYKPKIGRMLKDITNIKEMLNTEKKRFTLAPSGAFIAQVNANASGHHIMDITPNITQGTGYENRTGNSVKLTSMFLQFQFNTQANMTRGIKVQMYFIKIEGQSVLPNDLLNKFINPNLFITGASIYDVNAQRNPDYFKNYRVIRRHNVYIPPDDYSGQSGYKNVNLGFKLSHHLKWNANTSAITNGQILLLCVADNGNHSAATFSTLSNVYETSPQTGVTMNMNFSYYYVDN